jgi:conjugative relaxase-like TrwC/TraI family protein
VRILLPKSKAFWSVGKPNAAPPANDANKTPKKARIYSYMVKPQVRHSIAGTLDYFARDPSLSEEERHGIWLGRGAELTGLEVGSAIRPEDLECYLNGFSLSGERLFATKKENRRCAWDCVVTAEKSVSVAALCSKEARAVQAAFRIAVMRLLYHLESLAYRQDNAGTGLAQPTGNLIAAKYVHEASRHADPHIHAHLLLINATYGTTGWRSLEPANIYRNQTALRWVFNAELHRQFAAFGLRSAVDAYGITRLPVPQDICLKYSRAHAAIARMAADFLRDGNLPPQWERMQPPELINRLNDRSRPAKRPPLIDWQHLLSDQEKDHLSELLLIQPKTRSLNSDSRLCQRRARFLPTNPPPPPRPFNDPEHYQQQATELLGKALCETSLYYFPQVIKLTTCRIAAAHPHLPLGAFARAAYWWSKHRPKLNVFSRGAATKLEKISRHVHRSLSRRNDAQGLSRLELPRHL